MGAGIAGYSVRGPEVSLIPWLARQVSEIPDPNLPRGRGADSVLTMRGAAAKSLDAVGEWHLAGCASALEVMRPFPST